MGSEGILSATLQIGYAVGTSAPAAASGYSFLTNVKSIPALSSEPSTHQVTDLDETNRHVSIGGLEGELGTLGVTMNLNNSVVTAWEEMIEEYDAITSTEKMFFVIQHSKLTKAVYFSGKPYALPSIGGDVDAPLEITGNISVESSLEWKAKPTVA